MKTDKKQKLQTSETRVSNISRFPETFRNVESGELAPIEINDAEIGKKQYMTVIDLQKFDPIQEFQELAQKIGFEMIEKQSHYATAIKKEKQSSWIQMFGCLNWWGNQASKMGAVKIVVSNSSFEGNCDTITQCRIKALSRNNIFAQNFIQQFKEKVQKSNAIFKSSNSQKMFLSGQKIQQINTNPFHLQACAHFMFHKLLTNPQRSDQQKIIQKLDKGISQFLQAFKNIKESSESIPTPLINVMQLSKQIYNEILQIINKRGVQKNDYHTISPYLKIVIEKYIFEKTENLIKSIYNEKNNEIEAEFQRKRNSIINQMTVSQIFSQVLLNKVIRFENNQTDKQNQNGIPNKQKRIQFCQLACPQLQKVSGSCSPRQKIKSCQFMYANLKSFFYQKTEQKYQLSSMQDIIPVFIILVLCSQIKDLRSQLSIMLDFINADSEEFESQKRLIMNLSESYNYIVRDWKV